MLVVNLMHEVELGVWKALFTHLIHILYTMPSKGKLVGDLDKRYDHSMICSIIIIGLNCCRF